MVTTKLKLARLILATASAAIGFCASAQEVGVSKNQILIGQTAALTGTFALANLEINRGALAHFAEINAKGGIYGRKIKLVSVDDKYDPKLAVENFKALTENQKVFAMFQIGGTPANAALQPLLESAKVPHVAPLSGSDTLRTPLNRYVFHVRASYGAELGKIAEHLSTMGLKKVTVAYSDNVFGKGLLAGFSQFAKARGLELTPVVMAETEADVPKSTAALAAANPQALVSLSATAANTAVTAIGEYRKQNMHVPLYTISLLATAEVIKQLGPQAKGIVITQVTPYPYAATNPLVADYQAAMKKAGETNVGYGSLEGYLNARVLTAALQTAGREPTREKLVDALESTKLSTKEFEIKFDSQNHVGSRFVDLTIVGARGNLIK